MEEKNIERLHWNHELHTKFLRAIQKLGGEFIAKPKDIVVEMGVPGITLSHVKSHLQKYRQSKKAENSMQRQLMTTDISSLLRHQPSLSAFGPPPVSSQLTSQSNSSAHIDIQTAISMLESMQKMQPPMLPPAPAIIADAGTSTAVAINHNSFPQLQSIGMLPAAPSIQIDNTIDASPNAVRDQLNSILDTLAEMQQHSQTILPQQQQNQQQNGTVTNNGNSYSNDVGNPIATTNNTNNTTSTTNNNDATALHIATWIQSSVTAIAAISKSQRQVNAALQYQLMNQVKQQQQLIVSLQNLATLITRESTVTNTPTVREAASPNTREEN